jgi:DNA-directed RNA polymerase beta' subunit
VYAVKNADIQLQLDAETEFKSGIAEAELLIAAKEAGKTLVYEAYDENRFNERQQKLNQIQSIKANGLDFLRQKYGVNPQARASKANERLTQIQQRIAETDVDVNAFFAKK